VGHPPTRGCKSYHPALFTHAFHVGVDLITTSPSPPMLTQHLPRAHMGQGQLAHATISQISCLIRHLDTTQGGGIGFVWDTPVGFPLPAHVQNMMGPSTVLNALKCGSGAHRPIRVWQNLLYLDKLR